MKTERTTYCNCQAMYLDYVNNFITLAGFADYYGLSDKEAREVIEIGKAKNELKSIEKKRKENEQKQFDSMFGKNLMDNE